MEMECLVEEFVGAKEEIAYRFSAKEVEAGDVLEGEKAGNKKLSLPLPSFPLPD